MNKKPHIRQNILMIGLLLLFANPAPGQIQYRKWNIFDANRVATVFNNANQIANGNNQAAALSTFPSMEYPQGSGIDYGMVFGLVVGGFTTDGGGSNPRSEPYLDGAMDEGPAWFWDPNHYDPYMEFVNGDRAAMSDDPETWPTGGPNHGWPAVYPGTDTPVLVGSEGWPGFGKNGERIADQESFSVCFAVDHLAEFPPERWLKTQTTMRGLAWKLNLYEDMIFWVYTVRNMGNANIDSCLIGIYSDWDFISAILPPEPFGDADRQYYDPVRQLAYGSDDNGFELSPFGGSLADNDIAWAGTMFLKTPMGDDGKEMGVTTYDAFHGWKNANTPLENGIHKLGFYWYNMLNIMDPNDTDGDRIDDSFDNDGDGVFESDYHVAEATVNVLATGPFTLPPGETDTLVIATVFGVSKTDLLRNADRAISLFQKEFVVPKPPPEPVVQAVAEDRKVTLTWGRDSETDSTFEGYRIYRSQDQGATWGEPIIDATGSVVGFAPLAQFDLADGVTGTHPDAPFLDRGIDSGLEPLRQIINGDTVNVFTDESVVNGFSYWYSVTAYTTGDPATPPIENSRGTDPAIVDDNTVAVIPSKPLATQNLDDIRVVPNPYIVASGFETTPNVRELQFTHLPAECTIRIFNAAAELVATVEHTDGRSFQTWNLRTANDQEIAPGLYFYHIRSTLGEKIGKFVIIK